MPKYAILSGGNLESLERSGVRYVRPMYTVKVYVRHIKGEREVSRPLYPGYLFVLSEDLNLFFSSVRRGRILMTDDYIHLVDGDELAYVLPPEALRDRVVPKVGDMVRINYGPFTGIVGEIEAIDAVMAVMNTRLGSLKLPQELCEVIGNAGFSGNLPEVN